MDDSELLYESAETQTFVEGLDFYFENGLMVLSRRYLLNRGYCCSNGCRHCPFADVNAAAAVSE
jgi:2-iminoacetate synthase ThiH